MAKIIKRKVTQRRRYTNKALIVEVNEILTRERLDKADFKRLKQLGRRTRGTLTIKLA